MNRTGDTPERTTGPTAINAPLIPDFDLASLLAKGSFGEVWLARSETGVFRALKLIPAGKVTDVELEGIRTFERHVRAHRNLIDIRHVGSTPSHFYYVMELADDRSHHPIIAPETYRPHTLASEIEDGSGVPFERAVLITKSVLRGLEYLHTLGLLHRDVKPANVVFIHGIPKLADLGLITEQRRRRFAGSTPAYAPVEGVIDPSGDLYCVGKMFFEMIAGCSPSYFPELPESCFGEQLRTVTRIIPILDRACAPRAIERFSNAADFSAALDQISVEHEPQAQRAPRRDKQLRFGFVGLGAAGLLVAAYLRCSTESAGIAQHLPAETDENLSCTIDSCDVGAASSIESTANPDGESGREP